LPPGVSRSRTVTIESPGLNGALADIKSQNCALLAELTKRRFVGSPLHVHWEPSQWYSN